MGRTKIEWCNYSINPIKGLCPVDCKDNQGKSYCYARRMYKRFKWNPEIRFEPLDYIKFPAGSKVFVGSTMELFDDWVKHTWLEQIFEWCRRLPSVIFIFLTKRPQNLITWSPFPKNVWLGSSVTTEAQFLPAVYGLTQVECSKRFLSFEPLLENVLPVVLPAEWDDAIDWVIIGQQTPTRMSTMPKIEWIQEIIEVADKAGIPIFLKENLYDLFMSVPHNDLFWEDMSHLRQEFPGE